MIMKGIRGRWSREGGGGGGGEGAVPTSTLQFGSDVHVYAYVLTLHSIAAEHNT